MVFIGVDSGWTGGLTYIAPGGLRVKTMPETEEGIWKWFQNLPPYPKRAALEKVWAAPTKGRKQGTTSMFRFGHIYGFLRACLIAADIPFDEVTPQAWQKEFDLKPKKSFSSDNEWKRYLRAFAQAKVFPGFRIQLKAADSSLIAEWCKRNVTGTLTNRKKGRR